MTNKKILLGLSLFFLLAVLDNRAFAILDNRMADTIPEQQQIFDGDNDKIFESLFNKMSQASIVDQLPVIVVFKEKPDLNTRTPLNAVLKNIPSRRDYNNFPFMAMELSMGEIMTLAAMNRVRHLEFDKTFTIAMDTARYWYGAEAASLDFHLDGTGVVIAVLDSGIDGNHVDLDDGKIIGWKDFIQGRPNPYDDNGHGTSVSGIIAGSGEGNADYRGVASNAELVGVKVMAGWGFGTMSTVVKGIDWCIDQKDALGIDIINMSIGSSGSADGTDAASLAVNQAVESGITVVAAAGNEGPGLNTIGTPAAAEKAIAAGAMADIGEYGFFLASFSSRGPTADNRIKPDVVAPGSRMTCPKANSRIGYQAVYGTSFSAPFTAGAIALMLEANPDQTPFEIKSILEATAQDWGAPGKDVEYGSGRLDVYEAVKRSGQGTGENIDLPDHHRAEDHLVGFGSEDIWEFEVDDVQYPVAITLMEDSTSCFFSTLESSVYLSNIQIRLLDSEGQLLKDVSSFTRQATLFYQPQSPGIYRLKVISIFQDAPYVEGDGSADYTFEISGGLNESAGLTLIQDQ